MQAFLSQAEAGADIIAPSDMMDGRIGAIRSVTMFWPRTTNFSFVCCTSTIRFWYTLPILTMAPVEIMLRMSF